MSKQSENPNTQAQQKEPEELRENIAQTREELGETVDALSEKADVKKQVKEKVDERKERLRGTQAQAEAKLGEVGKQAKQNQTPLAAGVGGLVALVLLIVFLKRRS